MSHARRHVKLYLDIIQNGSRVNEPNRQREGAPTVNQNFSGKDTHKSVPSIWLDFPSALHDTRDGLDGDSLQWQGSGSGSGNTGGSNGATVKLGLNTFEQSSVTIAKGLKITLVDAQAAPHIIQNGSVGQRNRETG